MPQFILNLGDDTNRRHDFAKLSEFTQGYIECALWADGNADSLAGGEGDCEGADAGLSDLAPCAFAAMVDDARAFEAAHGRILDLYEHRFGRDRAHAGHDFWLSRNGHGTGFWDRGARCVGKYLDDAARKFCEKSLYRGDSGLIYLA